jgi:hypothetical protein
MNIDFAFALFAFAVGACTVGLWTRARTASREATAEAKGRQAGDVELAILRERLLHWQGEVARIGEENLALSVQKLLGHSSSLVTERYSHLTAGSLMDAANSASIAIKSAMPKAAV